MLGDGFYREAANIVSLVKKGKGRIKNYCYNSKNRHKKILFALVTEVCREYSLIKEMLQNADFHKMEKGVDANLAIVLAYEFLHKGALDCSEKLSSPILRNKTRLKAEYTKLKIKQPKSERVESMKYARVNSLLIDVESAIQQFKAEGFSFVESVKDVESPTSKNFAADEHIDELLVFPPRTDLTQSRLYKEGKIVIQDKASCMPAAVLSPPIGAHVIDTCAAPGNKTTQLAALVGNTGKVAAFERNKERFSILQNTLSKHQCLHVTAINADFLKVDPHNYRNVEYALVDPSCSGSGMLDDHEMAETPKVEDKSRLKSLANFQAMILKHVLKFPSIKKIVYSTCSIHEEENELVVKEILDSNHEFELCPNPLPLWPRRGIEGYPFAMDVIRADPKLDRMNGFFVACFRRKAKPMQ